MTYPFSAIQDLAADRKSALATGPFGSSIGSKTFRDEGVPVIRGSNLSEAVGLRLSDDGLVFIDPALAEKFARSKAVRGDLVFTCWGTVNQVGLIDERSKYEEYIVSNKQMKFSTDPRKANPLFIYYYFSSPLGQQAIADNTIGSSVPGFNLTALRSIRVPNPPLSIQNQIARCLGSLDDKIELNRRMNETIEEMARALFRDWFVGFGPTRRQMEGATDHAAIMGYALPADKAATLAPMFPAILGENGLPEGWSYSDVGTEFDVVMGQSPPGDTYNETGDGLPFFQGRRDFGFRFPSRRVYCTDPKRISGRDWTLLSVRAPVGDINRATEECAIGRGVGAFIHRAALHSFTYYTGLALRAELQSYDNDGTVFGSINQKQFKGLQVVVPNQSLEARFDEIAKPMDDKIRLNTEENQTLAEMRDLLLPKLMSGEICLNDVEAKLE